MSRTYFFDTSALVKIYHHETGTGYVDGIFREEQNTIVISELATVEFHSALARMLRMREIDNGAREEALMNFRKDCSERFVISPLNSMVVNKAQEQIKKHGGTHSIRTLDALQLASCILEGVDLMVFVCSDENLIKISRLEGIEAIDPEEKDKP